MNLESCFIVFTGHFLSRAYLDDARVVDQNIDGAEMFARGANHILDLSGMGQVARESQDGPGAAPDQILFGPGQFIGVSRRQRHLRPPGYKLPG
jgi:hypothetical protein